MLGSKRGVQVLRSEQKQILRQAVEQRNGLDHIIDVIERLESDVFEPQQFMQIKAALDARLKLLNKYLPDLKSVGPADQPTDQPTPVVIDAADYERMRRQMLDIDDC
jgi:hypothetical protein